MHEDREPSARLRVHCHPPMTRGAVASAVAADGGASTTNSRIRSSGTPPHRQLRPQHGSMGQKTIRGAPSRPLSNGRHGGRRRARKAGRHYHAYVRHEAGVACSPLGADIPRRYCRGPDGTAERLVELDIETTEATALFELSSPTGSPANASRLPGLTRGGDPPPPPPLTRRDTRHARGTSGRPAARTKPAKATGKAFKSNL